MTNEAEEMAKKMINNFESKAKKKEIKVNPPIECVNCDLRLSDMVDKENKLYPGWIGVRLQAPPFMLYICPRCQVAMGPVNIVDVMNASEELQTKQKDDEKKKPLSFDGMVEAKEELGDDYKLGEAEKCV